MTIPTWLRRLQALLFVLPLFALGCNGSSPTEPVGQTNAGPTKSVAAAPATQGAEGEESPGLRPGVAARGVARAAVQAAPQGAPRPAGTARTNVTPIVAESNGHGNGHGNGGNGNGHGNGNGGNGGNNGNGGNGGNNGNGGGNRRGELRLAINPDTWNTNWTHSSGNVQAFVRGKDATKIDPSSVELVAESGDTLAPKSTRINGGQLVATFAKSDAFDLLGDNVHSGDRVTVTLRFMLNDEQQELTDQIRIVGPDPGDGGGDNNAGDLTLNIQPDDWNTNWSHSGGQVHAFIRGDGLKDIDLKTVMLVGDDPAADPVTPLDVRRVGKQVVARFAKKAAYKSLDDPHSGETHTVKIVFQQAGADVELSEDVHIIGP